MYHRRGLSLALFSSAVIALAGCQTQPRIVINDLPADSILSSLPPPVTVKQSPPPSQQAPEKFPASWSAPAHARPWRWIIIHHSSTDVGSVEIFDRMHRARGWDELGYHFVITNGNGGQDGQVQVGSRWTKQKWGAHCGRTPNNEYNNYGIGVCLVGDFRDRRPSQAQLKALAKLVGFLADRYGVEPSCVIGHRDAPNNITKCPGDALYRYLNTKLRPPLRRARQLAGG